MAPKHTILVTSPGGNIGKVLVPLLLEQPVKLILVTSNADRLKSNFPKAETNPNIVIEEGSISDPRWVEDVLVRNNVDSVFMNLTTTEEFAVTLNMFDAMDRSKTVKHLTYLSAAGDYITPEGFAKVCAYEGGLHVLVKPIVEQKLFHTMYPWKTAVVGPTIFMDNDLGLKPMILKGTYFMPLPDRGISRVSIRDIAEVAKNTLLDQEKWEGKKIDVGTKKTYTAADTRQLWAEATGREISTLPDDKKGMDEYEDAILPVFHNSPAFTRSIRLMFRTFVDHGFSMTDDEYDLQVQCLGRDPESYETFVKRTAEEWTR